MSRFPLTEGYFNQIEHTSMPHDSLLWCHQLKKYPKSKDAFELMLKIEEDSGSIKNLLSVVYAFKKGKWLQKDILNRLPTSNKIVYTFFIIIILGNSLGVVALDPSLPPPLTMMHPLQPATSVHCSTDYPNSTCPTLDRYRVMLCCCLI